MSDTIYRQDAINVAMQYCSDDDGTCSKADEDIRNLLDELEDLPPAQQTLYGYNIEHLAYIAKVMQKEGVTAEYAVRTFDDMSRALGMIIEELNEKLEKTLENLPSAQLEPLTDKEQRIFLAAMRREEEVCKQVDDECKDCKKPYENSLVRTCHEITRKVKGALWMI